MCSIQEAWNEPSFAKAKKNTTPLAMQRQLQQCVGAGGSAAAGASASPYDPYTGESGREFAAIASTPSPQQRSNRKQQPQSQPQDQYVGKETFMCGGPTAAGSGMVSRGKDVDPVANNIPYSAQANDYKYYCDAMGICAKPAISLEGFTDDYGSESYLRPSPSPKTQGQAAGAGAGGARAIAGIGAFAPRTPQCPSPQAPIYQYPISDDSKQQYAAAMAVYNTDADRPPQTPPTPLREIDMSNVTGLYDDEIEQYMHVPAPPAAASSAPSAATAPAAAIPEPTQSPAIFSNAAAPVSPAAPAKCDKWQYIMDMVLFIASGVLIIVLCELLFKIALSVGMKDTFVMMEPYLRELAELKLKISEVALDVDRKSLMAPLA